MTRKGDGAYKSNTEFHSCWVVNPVRALETHRTEYT